MSQNKKTDYGYLPELGLGIAESPLEDWQSLARDLERPGATLLEIWRKGYEEWKHGYERFRNFEERMFYEGDGAGNISQPDEKTMRLHRRCLFALMSSGEKCLESLMQLPVDREEVAEQMKYRSYAGVLIESLQESLDLWHPVNRERADRSEAFRRVAA
jgi:hypothetical protein